MNTRTLLLGGGLLVTMVLTAWTLATGDSDEVVQATARPAGTVPVRGVASSPPRAAEAKATQTLKTAAADASAGAAMGMPQRPAAPQAIRNAFGAYSYQPPPRVVVAAAPPTPHAPPLPFVFSGRLMIPGKPTIYLLTQGNAPVEVHLGSDIDGFKLVTESPEQLVFLHAATGDRVAMSIASAAIN